MARTYLVVIDDSPEARVAARVSKATGEQATAAREITAATESMRVQCEQASRAGKEQTVAMREMSLATQNTVKQMKLITAANREHSTVAASIQGSLGELRELSDRNVRRIQQAVGGRSNGKARNGR